MVSTVSTTVSEEMMVEFKAEITPVQLFVSDYMLLFSKNQRMPSSTPHTPPGLVPLSLHPRLRG